MPRQVPRDPILPIRPIVRVAVPDPECVPDPLLPQHARELAILLVVRIPVADHPFLEAVMCAFYRLIDDPDSDRVQAVVARDVAFILDRSRIDAHQLYVVFERMAGEFECLLSRFIEFAPPAWLLPGGRSVPTSLALDPAIQEIRQRLDPGRARRVIDVYGRLCGDTRKWIPRPDLRSFDLPASAVDRACRSPADREPGRPMRYSRDSLLRYVRGRWRPRREAPSHTLRP